MYALYISMVQSVNYGSRMFTCARWVCFVWFNAEHNTSFLQQFNKLHLHYITQWKLHL